MTVEKKSSRIVAKQIGIKILFKHDHYFALKILFLWNFHPLVFFVSRLNIFSKLDMQLVFCSLVWKEDETCETRRWREGKEN